MTITERPNTAAPMLEVRYTIEELAVLADLFDLESLPGVQPIEDMSLDLRSLATRCLVARGIVVMPDNGGVEVTQPHASLIAAMLQAGTALQVSRIEGDRTDSSTWFDLGADCVCVGGDDEGLVTISAYAGAALTAVEAIHGITVVGNIDGPAEADVVVELTTTTLNTDPASAERSVVARVDGQWQNVTGE